MNNTDEGSSAAVIEESLADEIKNRLKVSAERESNTPKKEEQGGTVAKNDEQSQEQKLCFFKFYNFNRRSNKEEFHDKFFAYYINVLLEYGYGKIKTMLESYESPNGDIENRFIYTQRHMGITSLFRALKKVWIGECDAKGGYKEYKDKKYQCLLVSFAPHNKSGDNKLLWFINRNVTEENRNYSSDLKKTTNGAFSESRIIETIKKKIKSLYLGSIFAKKLILLDDLDRYFCEIGKKKEMDWNFLFLYRKCWLKAILELNAEYQGTCAIVAGLLTKLMEYAEKEQEQEVYMLFGHRRHLLVWELPNSYNEIISKFGDACFCGCPRSDDIDFYKCQSSDKCIFSLGEEYYNTDTITLEMTKHIKTDILQGIYVACNGNPWWLIVPLTHVMEGSKSCQDIDAQLKIYYQNQLGERDRGALLDELLKNLPLYCDSKCNSKRLKIVAKSFQELVKNAAANKKTQLDLKDTTTSQSVRRHENLVVKRMFVESGLLTKTNLGNPDSDDFTVHPFVVYIYSDQKLFQKDRSIENGTK